MLDREPPTKFGLDRCSDFRETSVYGRRTDACGTTIALLTKSSRSKNTKEEKTMVKPKTETVLRWGGAPKVKRYFPATTAIPIP